MAAHHYQAFWYHFAVHAHSANRKEGSWGSPTGGDSLLRSCSFSLQKLLLSSKGFYRFSVTSHICGCSLVTAYPALPPFGEEYKASEANGPLTSSSRASWHPNVHPAEISPNKLSWLVCFNNPDQLRRLDKQHNRTAKHTHGCDTSENHRLCVFSSNSPKRWAAISDTSVAPVQRIFFFFFF